MLVVRGAHDRPPRYDESALDRTWVSACSSVTRCFGSNIAAGRCDEGDCGLNALGVCAQAEARSVSWGNWA
jgi:hypothetical protein